MHLSSARYCHGTVLTHTVSYYLVLSHTVSYYLVLFPTVGWPTTSALAAATTICVRYPLLPPSPLHTTMQLFSLLALQHCDSYQDNNQIIASISLLYTLQLYLARSIIFKKKVIGYYLPSRYNYNRIPAITLLEASVSSINLRSGLQ